MNSLITNVTVAGIFSSPNFQSEMISQSLLWEKLYVLDINENWLKVKQFDDYEGWIHKFYTIKNDNNIINSATYIETNLIGNILTSPKLNSRPIINCTFGTVIPAIETKNFNNSWWHKIILPDFKNGWIQDSGYKKSNSMRKTVKQIAELFLGTPYVWGGRSSYGFDCSGFVQTIFKFCGISLPRDSKNQLNYHTLVEQNKDENKIGDLLFFEKNNKINHIGISLGNDKYIHSSGYVRINSLNPKEKNFDKSLFTMYHSSKSIRNII